MKNVIKKIASIAMAFTLLGTVTAVTKTISPKTDNSIVASAQAYIPSQKCKHNCRTYDGGIWVEKLPNSREMVHYYRCSKCNAIVHRYVIPNPNGYLKNRLMKDSDNNVLWDKNGRATLKDFDVYAPTAQVDYAFTYEKVGCGRRVTGGIYAGYVFYYSSKKDEKFGVTMDAKVAVRFNDNTKKLTIVWDKE